MAPPCPSTSSPSPGPGDRAQGGGDGQQPRQREKSRRPDLRAQGSSLTCPCRGGLHPSRSSKDPLRPPHTHGWLRAVLPKELFTLPPFVSRSLTADQAALRPPAPGWAAFSRALGLKGGEKQPRPGGDALWPGTCLRPSHPRRLFRRPLGPSPALLITKAFLPLLAKRVILSVMTKRSKQTKAVVH